MQINQSEHFTVLFKCFISIT